MSKPIQAIKIADFKQIKADEICYYKENGTWYIYLPNCGVGSLKSHTVIENGNDTITVSPSILMKSNGSERHGWLINGRWHEG